MQLFSFHLAETTPATTAMAMCRPPTSTSAPGLHHAECMAAMTLGSPIVSPARMQLRNLAMFAAWESEAALDAFLAETKLGRALTAGWHVRLTFSTFSVWRSQREMTDMVHGRGSTLGADRHAAAMVERNRKDFHYQFTTLRFRAIAEHGKWAGRRDIVPQ